MVDFIRNNLIYHYSVPKYIITDSKKPFYNSFMDGLCNKLGFEQHNFSIMLRLMSLLRLLAKRYAIHLRKSYVSLKKIAMKESENL